jgi:phospholipid/cholesterol/gamma-HCH transport system permease protein
MVSRTDGLRALRLPLRARRSVERVGRIARRSARDAGEMIALLVLGARGLLELPLRSVGVVAGVAVRQTYFTGVQALPLTGLIGFLLGGVVVIQAVARFPALGLEALVGDLLVIAILRELGPLVTTVVVIGRSGTAIATELATMTVRREVEDLETLGIDPIQYLFVPRLIGVVAALFGLIVYFDLTAIAGGYAALALWGSPPWLPAFLSSLTGAMDLSDAALLPVKALLFGALIAAFASHRGLGAGASPTEVPRAAARAVVGALLAAFLADATLAAVVYL